MRKLIIFVVLLLAVSQLFIVNNVYAIESNSNSNSASNSENKNLDETNSGFLNSYSYVYCGGDSSDKALINNIPVIIPKITSSIYNAVLVIVPLILVIMGSIDLFKASLSQNEDEIKKGKTNFMKRLIIGVITFLIVLLSKFFVSAISKDQTRIISCIDCFINNTCGYVSNPGNPYEEAPKSNSKSSNTNNSSNTSNASNRTSHSSSGGKF